MSVSRKFSLQRVKRNWCETLLLLQLYSQDFLCMGQCSLEGKLS